jgi:uncharacterized protein (DUF885 family)
MIETLRTFTALSEEFVELFMKQHPVAATEAGIHDYDHVLPDDSPSGLRERASWLRDLEQRLVASVPWDELPLEARVDFALLRSRLSTLRAELEEIRVPQRAPALFLERAFMAVHLPLSRTTAPADERKEAAVARLMAIPDYLDAAAPNLSVVPPVLLEAGVELAARGPGFVDDVVRRLLRQFPGEAERLEHAGSRARTGFLRFHDHLDRTLRPQAQGSAALGERWMNFLLEHEHLVPRSSSELGALAREELTRVRGRLEEEARRVDPRRTWRELIAEGRDRHPESSWLREAYVAELERARRFVQERSLVTLAEGEKLEVVETPLFLRARLPHTGYQGPAPFDADLTGYLWLTPVDLRRDKDTQERQLQEHCAPLLPLHVLRAGYPGAHTMRVGVHRATTRLRKVANNDAFRQGWVAHAETTMADEGFFTTDPLTTLFALAEELDHACLAVIETGLHAGHLSSGEAASMLIEETGCDPDEAATRVRSCWSSPLTGTTALAGRHAFRELHEEARRRLGGRFGAAAFSDALLAGGAIPPALVGEEVWERLGAA